ncbi:MAG TPA: hypothetical protein VGD67_29400 [Pseudonocardiaceae bacterium]
MLVAIAVLVQLVSLTVLPWATTAGDGASVIDLWRAAVDQGASGFGDWYVVLFSYPLAALSILLGLAAVLESAALKVIWGGLALIGLGVLVVRYGLGPLTGLAGDGGAADFSTRDVTIATIAVGALVAVVFVLKMAVATFRRAAGVILLGIGGVHVAAVTDLGSTGIEQLGAGAFGPALGYLLTAIAAFIGPHRLLGL